MKTLTLRGTLTAVGPVAVSPPGVALKRDTKDSPSRLPRAGWAFDAPRYLPASTLRHVLRHNVTGAVLEALTASGGSIDVGPLLMLSKGYTRIKLKDGAASSENVAEAGRRISRERAVREKNPMLSMFGAWGVPADLRVGNAHPHRTDGRDAVCERHGAVRRELEEDIEDMLPPALLQQYSEIVIDSERPLDERKKDKDGRDGIFHYKATGWEEIVAGTPCDWQIVLHRADAHKAGAILAALRRFSADPFIGAHRALGCGEIAIDLHAEMVAYEPLRNPERVNIGRVRVNAKGEGEQGAVPFDVSGGLVDMLSAFDSAARAGFPGWDFSALPKVSGSAWGDE